MGIEVVCNECGALKPVTKLCPYCRFDEPTRIPEYYDCCCYCADEAKEELEYYDKLESEPKIYNPRIDKTIVPIKGRYAKD